MDGLRHGDWGFDWSIFRSNGLDVMTKLETLSWRSSLFIELCISDVYFLYNIVQSEHCFSACMKS